MSLRRQIAAHFLRPADELAAAADFVTPGEAPDEACAESAPRTPSGAAAPAPPRMRSGAGEPAAPRMPSAGAARASAAAPAPCGVAVLSSAHDALALGGAVGLAVARSVRAPVVVLCVWTDQPASWPGWRAPALPGATRMAQRLAARGHDARATGRLAIVRLDDGACARRVLAAAGAAPTVLAIGGPRTPAIDELLADQDLVVVGTRGESVAALTALTFAGLPHPARACACEVPAAHPGRSLAAAGVLLLPSVRRALAPAAGALS